MVRIVKNLTISKESAEYLKSFENESRTVDEALEIHKNKDKIVVKNDSGIKNVRIEI